MGQFCFLLCLTFLIPHCVHKTHSCCAKNLGLLITTAIWFPIVWTYHAVPTHCTKDGYLFKLLLVWSHYGQQCCKHSYMCDPGHRCTTYSRIHIWEQNCWSQGAHTSNSFPAQLIVAVFLPKQNHCPMDSSDFSHSKGKKRS